MIESKIAFRVEYRIWRQIRKRDEGGFYEVQEPLLRRVENQVWFQVRNGVEDHLRQEIDNW